MPSAKFYDITAQRNFFSFFTFCNVFIYFFCGTKKPTWWLTLTNSVCFPQPGVSVAGQITPDDLAFGQNADEDGDGDGRDDNGHQELPVLRAVLARRSRQSVCKRESYDLRSRSEPCSIINFVVVDFFVVLWSGLNTNTWCILATKLEMKEQLTDRNNDGLFSTCDALPFCVVFGVGMNPVVFNVLSILVFVQPLTGCVFSCVD